MAIFFAFMTFFSVWAIARVQVRGGWGVQLAVHGTLMLVAIAMATAASALYLADHHQL